MGRNYLFWHALCPENMSKSQYSWLSAMVMLAMRNPQNEKPPANDEGGPWALASVNARAGQFMHVPVQSANDMKARLLISVLLAYLIYANNCAKLMVFCPVLRKMRSTEFRVVSAPQASIHAALLYWSALPSQCQINHLPTLWLWPILYAQT